jgi:membrane protein
MLSIPFTLVLRLLRFVAALSRRGASVRLAQAAASLAFLSLLAIVPIVSIAISLLGALPIFADLRGAGVKFLASNLFLPNFSETIVGYLNLFAEKVGQLSALGAVLFFATAFSALRTIDETLNQIWEVDQPVPWSRRLPVYWTFLTLGPLLVTASAAVNTMMLSEVLAGISIRALETAWVLAVPWFSTLVGLTLLYRLVPNVTVRWRDALVGALVAAVTLELLKRAMGYQLGQLPTYTIVYGAFAVLPIFFIWIFLLWLTVLGGALVAAMLPQWGQRGVQPDAETPAARFERADRVLETLVQAAVRGQVAVPASELRGSFGGDAALAAQTVALLVDAGYVQRAWRLTRHDPDHQDAALWGELWMLAPDAGQRTRRALFERIWHSSGRRLTAGAVLFDLAHVDQPLLDCARSN